MSRPLSQQIDHLTAERMRAALGDIQQNIMADPAVPPDAKERLIILISDRAFRMVDEMEGVIR